MSLAQLFFDGHQLGDTAVKELKDKWLLARSFLSHGFERNHTAPAHKVMADFAAKDEMGAAQRFVVENSELDSLLSLGSMFLSTGTFPRLPSNTLWIEYPSLLSDKKGEVRAGKVGLLAERDGEDRFKLNSYTNFYLERIPTPWLSGSVSFDGERVDVALEWTSMREGLSSWEATFNEIVINLLGLMAAMNVPRVITRESVRWQQAIQRARLKRGKHPLLSFNKVAINLPKHSLHSGETMRRETGGGVRFHSVLGHLRRVDRPSGPALTWVSPHFRGDARLGVVVKERTLKAAH